jgi:predicted HTH domain antitoxin
VTMTTVDLPDELLALLDRSRLGARPRAEQVRVAVAMHLFQEGVISTGRAAELAGIPRATFELLLRETGVAPVSYDAADYEREWQAIRQARAVASADHARRVSGTTPSGRPPAGPGHPGA